mgnify:CR=1 FL=1
MVPWFEPNAMDPETTAELLEGVYEARGEHRSLVRMLEIRLEAATDPELRARLQADAPSS